MSHRTGTAICQDAGWRSRWWQFTPPTPILTCADFVGLSARRVCFWRPALPLKNILCPSQRCCWLGPIKKKKSKKVGKSCCCICLLTTQLAMTYWDTWWKLSHHPVMWKCLLWTGSVAAKRTKYRRAHLAATNAASLLHIPRLSAALPWGAFA